MKKYPRFPSKAIAFLTAILASVSILSAGLVFDKSEFAARRQKLMARIPDGAAVVFGAQMPTGYVPFFQNSDFHYLCGVEVPNAVLIVDGVRKTSTLFFTIAETAAFNEGISLDLVRNAKDVTGIEQVLPLDRLEPTLAGLAARTKVLYTPFQPEELPRECSLEKLRTLQTGMVFNLWDGRRTREQQAAALLKDRFPQVEVRDASSLIWELRTIKSPAEIALLRKAGKIAVQAHIGLMKAVRPGMHEYELAALYDYLCRKEGCQELAYYVIVASGENHTNGHAHSYNRVLLDGDILVVDAGPRLDYYNIDITTSYPANGVFTPRQKEIYEAVNAVHEANMKVYRAGLTLEQCQAEVTEILKKQGFDLAKDYFKRLRGGFGHYVGMAVHDVGGRFDVLKPGMVIANEPAFVSAGEKIGVRIEDTILITENGCENLTSGLPRAVKDVEALMKKTGQR
jgi:Xaa-Pro aminopeptidase